MKRSFLIVSALLLGIYIFGGCSKDIKGPPRGNVPPIVEFVNIPVEDARFSSDTTIYWYGTDADGFIRYFRYAVVESTVVGPDPEAYISSTPDANVPWIVRPVTLDNPSTKEKIKMSADVRDPVRKFIASYVFLQAVDNLGAKSKVVYRRFRKNNHFPETLIGGNVIYDPYVNAKTSAGALAGVTVSFAGTDPIDYPRNPPPFEFHWKLFGPFDSLTMDHVNKTYVETVFVDIYGDFFHINDWFKILKDVDTTIDTIQVPPETTIVRIYDSVMVATTEPQLKAGSSFGSWGLYFKDTLLETDYGSDKLVEESYNPLTGDYWVWDTQIHIYDVFRKEVPSIDTTQMKYYFVWCQSRDDSKVPDPVPDYKIVSVIDPKFERDVLLLDATVYGAPLSNSTFNFAMFPLYRTPFYDTTPTVIKNIYGGLINNWKPNSFDTANLLPPDTIFNQNGTIKKVRDYTVLKCTQDYFTIGNLKNDPEQGIGSISLRDVLKHKIILLIRDNAYGGVLDFDRGLEASYIIKGLSAGMSVWTMARSPFGGSFDLKLLQPADAILSFNYAILFGIGRLKYTGWKEYLGYNREGGWGYFGQVRIEDFIGAASLKPGEFPDLTVDTTLLRERYYWISPYNANANRYSYEWRCNGHIVGAYPEVGYIEKLSYAEPLYLYNSCYGDATPVIPVPIAKMACSGGIDSLQVGRVSAYSGTVVAVRANTNLFRTAHFAFTFVPMKDEGIQTMFNSMMDWLSVQPYIITGKLAPGGTRVDINQLRQINNQFDEMKKQGLLTSMCKE